MGWGRLSEKSNIPQRESRISFWPCVRGTEYFSLARTLGQPGGWAQNNLSVKTCLFKVSDSPLCPD